LGFFGCLLPLLLIVPLLCTALLRFVLRPMQVPERMIAASRREKHATILIFTSMFIWTAGAVLLTAAYILGLYRHLRRRGPASPDDIPRVPRIALSELLAMIFSVGLLPVMLQTLFGSKEKIEGVALAYIFGFAALFFPMCFMCAYHRLDSNRIPQGKLRLAFIFLYPYLMLACVMLFIATVTALYLAQRAEVPLAIGGIAIVILVLGRLLAEKVRAQAEPSLDFP